MEKELASFSETLTRKPKIVVASKMDVLPPEERESLRTELEERLGLPVMSLSAVTGQGIQPLLDAASRLVEESAAGV